MYTDRLKTLTKAYRAAERNNALYSSSQQELAVLQGKVLYLSQLHEQLTVLGKTIIDCECEWRDAVLAVLETGIVDALSFVYPTDGYRVTLDARVLRGKIHITAKVNSVFTEQIPGRIKRTQGRLFQQVVSFAALISVMKLLGIQTVYIDEAFSGSSKPNVKKLNGLLEHLRESGFNLVIIAQDTSMANGLIANRIFVSRSVDNVTTVKIGGGP